MVLAKLIKFAPDNRKLNTYIINTYIAYGYPGEAYTYFKANRKRLDESKLASVLAPLFDAVVENGDEKSMRELLSELSKCHLRSGHRPNDILILMAFKAKLVAYYFGKKAYRKVIKTVDTDIKWFDAMAMREKRSAYWASNIKDKQNMKESYFSVTFPASKANHLQYRAMAYVALKKRKKLFKPFDRIIKIIENNEIDSGSRYEKSVPDFLSRLYLAMSRVAKYAGDVAKEKEYGVLSKKLRAEYNELRKAERR